MSLAIKSMTAWPMMVLLALVALLPLYGPWFPPIEGALFPVTSKITVGEAVAHDGSMLFRFSYEKYRTCEIVGVEATINGKPVDFGRADDTPPGTRIPGDQTSRVWRLGSPSLDGLAVFFIHRCHPYWITITKVL